MENLPFSITDIVVGLVVLVSALLAYGRGFVHEVLSVGGWAGAIFATIYGFPYARPYARDLISLEIVADIGAGVAIFAATLLVLSIITGYVSSRIRRSTLNALDRALGFLLGLIRGAVVVCLAYLGAQWYFQEPGKMPEWLASARTASLMDQGAQLLVALVPKGQVKAAGEAAGKLRGQAGQAAKAEKEMREILNVKPKGETIQPDPDGKGYGKHERSDMQRLIESNQ